jgi:hypothetical protein
MKLMYIIGVVVLNSRKMSDIIMAEIGRMKRDFLSKCAPAKRARAPIGAKLGG